MLLINSDFERLRFSAMSEYDLASLQKNGHTIAAHGWDHKPLSTLPIEMQRHEFMLCKEYSKRLCNSDLYSYPFGTKQEVSFSTVRLCKEYAFSAAYMNNSLVQTFVKEDAQYQLSRLNLPNVKNRYILDAKLSGFEFLIKKILKRT